MNTSQGRLQHGRTVVSTSRAGPYRIHGEQKTVFVQRRYVGPVIVRTWIGRCRLPRFKAGRSNGRQIKNHARSLHDTQGHGFLHTALYRQSTYPIDQRGENHR